MDFFNNQQENMQKAEQLFRHMQPHLEAELRDRLINGIEIEVSRPIRTFSDRVAKSDAVNPSFSLGQEVIPQGAKLLYKGCELNQMFFEDTRTGKEYGVYSCDTVALGEMQATRNTGYVGLLTNTDIFQDVKNRILGR